MPIKPRDATSQAHPSQPVTVRLFGRSQVGKERAKDEDAFLVSDLADTPPIHHMDASLSLEVKDRGVLIAVSDGMGGAQAGEVASSMVLSSLWQGMSSVQAKSARTALRNTIEDANQEVFDNASATGRQGMGATLTALLFSGTNVYIAEIGDSRAYLVRDGTIFQLTRDQTVVQQLVDAGAMTREDARTSHMKNVVLQAMGIRTDIEVALNRLSLLRHDRFVVCSDGLSGPLTDQEILDILLTGRTLESTCAALIGAAVNNGGTDDITVVLAEVDGQGAPEVASSEHLAFDVTLPQGPVLTPAPPRPAMG